jgi:hypothetical protein
MDSIQRNTIPNRMFLEETMCIVSPFFTPQHQGGCSRDGPFFVKTFFLAAFDVSILRWDYGPPGQGEGQGWFVFMDFLLFVVVMHGGDARW